MNTDMNGQGRRFKNPRCECERGPAVHPVSGGFGECVHCRAVRVRNAAVQAAMTARQRVRTEAAVEPYRVHCEVG